ncbi:MAG: helix-turn-helix domain-containing protein [Acidobacteriota bacterium]
MGPIQTPADEHWSFVDLSESTPIGTWRIVLAFPEGPLAEQVEAVWSSEGVDCFEEQEILPRTRTEVLFCVTDRHWLREEARGAEDLAFETSFVSGLQQKPLRVESPPNAQMCGVRLRPAGVANFLRDTPRAIAGEVVELDGLLGPQVERLRSQVVESRDLEHRTRLLAGAVERHLAPSPPLSAAVRFGLQSLHESDGSTPIREIVRATGFSHRYVTERFRDEIGLSPKAYARLVRFESAFERLQQVDSVHWAEFALDAGYYDQAHLVRDFRQLSGATPTEVFRRRSPDGLGLLNEEDTATLRGAQDNSASGSQARS